MLELVDDEVVTVISPGGEAVHGKDAWEKGMKTFLEIGLPLAIKVRSIHQSRNTALVVADWLIEGTGVDGNYVKISGTGADVLRKSRDGNWRYVIDNPFGTSSTSHGVL
jgi:ketosteroid isomerase-like protein